LLAATSIFLTAPFKLFGQFNSTTYYMQNLPQSALMNPAIQPGCNFFMSFSGLTMDISNSAVSFYDVFGYYNEAADLYYSAFDSLATQADKDDFISKFKSLNTISSAFNMNIFAMGFRAQDNYFTFHIAERINTNIDYPSDLLRLMINGNSDPGIYDLSGFGGRFNAYQEVALSYSGSVDNTLTYGMRGKLLFGQVDFSVSKQDITLEVIDNYNFTVNTSFELNGSTSLLNIETVEGEVDTIYFDTFGTNEIISTLLGKQNLGFGLDLGVNYNAGDRLGISASVLDLGMIRWKKNAFNLSLDDATFNYQGVELDFFGDEENGEEDTTFFETFIDSIKNTFALSSTNNAYSSFLTTKVLLGVNYKLHKRVDVGLLAYTEIYRMKFFPRLTLSANFRPFNFINASFSYSVLNKEYYNLGFGLSFKPGPFNWYVIGDTYPLVVSKGGTPLPVHSKGFRIQMGFNFAFGTKKNKGGQDDMPLMDY